MKKYINEQGWGGEWNPGGGSGNNNGWNQGGGSGNNNGWNQGGGNTTGLPNWAKCLESSGVKRKNDNVVSFKNNKGNTLYFSKSGKFQYTFTSKPGTANQIGKWRCNGTNGYLVDMDNGDRWDGTKWIEGSQNNSGGGGNGSTGGGSRVSGKYHDCPTGPYTQGCKSEVIRKVQGCLNVKTDGLFGPKTQGALESKGFKKGFTDADITKLCVTSSADGTVVGDSNIVSSNLPDWATCLKIIKTLKVTQDSKGDVVVKGAFDKDSGYFWQDMTFLYVSSKNGTKYYGKWSCENNKLVIKTDDGQMWMSGSGWTTPPDKSELPDTNFNSTEVSGDEFSPSNQNESAMNNLENIISEVNSLIIEQTQQIVQAPKNELTTLTTSPFLKDKGTLEALCRSNNGTSKPVNVNGRIYFAGKKSTRKGVQYYLTYDGMVLKREGDSCKFTYAPTDDGKGVMRIKGLRADELTLPYREILMKFGIDPTNYDTDPYYLINNISKDLQNLVKQGAVSTVFKSWNDMLTYYHSTDYAEFALVPESGKTLEPPTNRGLLAQYMPINGRNYGLNYNNKDVQILYPSNKAPVTSGGENQEFTKKDCDAAIKGYLSAAIRYQTRQDKSDNKTINSAENREFIKGCDGSGVYQDLVITPDELPKVKKDNKVFNFWRGDTLNIKNVYKLLSGKDKNLPAGQNPYLPFIIDRSRNESKTKLDNLIKENLQKLSEEKNNNLLSETKIIQTRTKILTENRILKLKQPREKFFNEIISEAIYLESQGFDKQLIKEEFWDVLKGLFGQHGSEAIFGTFKEYMGKWLLQKLTPVNPDGWIGSIVVAAIGNLHIDDLSKLTDCSFLTKKLASSIGEGIARKIQHDKGYDGGISDIVRNGLFSAIDNSQMVQSLETGLAKLICPALSGVKTKLEDKAKKMKTMAVQA